LRRSDDILRLSYILWLGDDQRKGVQISEAVEERVESWIEPGKASAAALDLIGSGLSRVMVQ
jgi:hypothetical protein